MVLLGSAWVSGQEKQHFEGPFKVGEYQGQAEFDFTIKEGDTILDGPFSLFRSNLNALLQDKDNFFSFNGAFAEGYPNGDWKFEFGEFESGDQSKVVDLQYRLNVSGTTDEASGAISKGKPNGPWSFTTNKIENSEVQQTLFSSTITFENGIPQKSFKIENSSSTLVGRFLRNGLAHDEWTLYTDEAMGDSESWVFDNGFLQRVEKQGGGETSTWNIDRETARQEKVMNLDARYLQIMQLWQSGSDAGTLSAEGINQLLSENASHYQAIDDILSQLGKSQFMPHFKVKVNHYPLDSIEIQMLREIGAFYAKSEEVGNGLLNNTQLNILRRSDEEAQFLYTVVERLSTSVLEPMGKLLDYVEKDLIEFIPEKRIIKHLWPQGMPNHTIEVPIPSTDGTRAFIGPKATSYDFDALTINSVSKLAEYTTASLDSISEVLQHRIQKESRLQEVVALEEKMISNVDHLNQLTDSLQAQSPRLETKALKRIQSFAEDQLKLYSNMEDSPTKIEEGKRIMDCLSQLDGLAQEIATLANKWEIIQEKYEDAVWNPFMATIMNEEVKKRITGSYKNVLVPYILNTVIEDLNCDNAGNITQLLISLDERMLAMRDEDTSKLERKLRREKNPETLLQLFNLQSLEE